MRSWKLNDLSFSEVAPAVWVLAVCGLAAVFAQELREGEPVGLDLAIEEALARIRDPSVTAVARDITALGSSALITLGGLSAAAVLLAIRQRRLLARIALTLVGAVVLVLGLKLLVGRVRPGTAAQAAEISGPSFPSGHTLVSTAFYLGLAPILASRFHRKSGQRVVIVVCHSCAGLVGLSRVYLGVHFATDVIAGWAIGSAWTICAAWIIPWSPRSSDMVFEDATKPPL